MKVIVVGAGETGLTLSNLLGENYEVTIVEKDEKKAEDITNKTNALVIHGDGTDVSILKEAGIDKADALIATSSDDTTNLVICLIAKSEKVRKIIPIVHSPKNEELFTKLEVTSLVSIAGSSASEIRKQLQIFGDARIIAQLGEGEVQIIQQVIKPKSKLIGNKAVIRNAIVATIYRKGKLTIPTPEMALKEGDVLLVVVKTQNLHRVVDLIRGE